MSETVVDLASLLDPRVLLVTGKGGVGKSSVAAALALAGSRTGQRTCLVEVEGRQTMARLFSTPPWGFDEEEFRPHLVGMSMDPEASLAEYLQMFYGAKRLSRLVVGSSAVEFATAAAPGIKDVLLIGKVREMERRRNADGRFHYDLIVVDAPPSGRIVNFLRAPHATTELVPGGPIRTQAQSLVDMLLDGERTHVELVTLLEEMPVAETIESAAALRELGVTVGPTIVNRVQPERLDDEARAAMAQERSDAALAAVLGDADVVVGEEGAAALRQLGETHLARLDLQERMRGELHGRLGVPALELPYLHGAEFGEAQLTLLARLVEEAVQ